jgi:hypothetical protein
MISLS